MGAEKWIRARLFYGLGGILRRLLREKKFNRGER